MSPDAGQAKPFSVRATGENKGSMLTTVKSRQYSYQVDEPAELGGSDKGPNPVEYVLGSLIGCAGVMLAIVGKEEGFSYKGADFDIKGTMDLRGLAGVPEICRHFQEISGTITVDTDEPDKLDKVVKIIEDRCPVFNLLHDAGVKLSVEWTAK